MKELTLKELQDFSLDILKDVHKFCVENDIQYTIAYGTLIGAVRHKGFIPWDEDIDIAMTRENYNKFIKLYKSDKYEFICPENSNQTWLLFGRVCDKKRTVAKTTTAWLDGEDSGVWIDVFPLDNASDDETEYNITYKLLNHLYLYCLSLRKAKSHIRPDMSLKFKFKIWLKSKFNPNLVKKDPRDFTNYMKKIIDTFSSNDSKHLSQMCCADSQSSYWEKSNFDEYVELPFEDTKVMACKGYESVLVKTFGDYMKPPTFKEIKKISQRRYLKFYWKKQHNK